MKRAIHYVVVGLMITAVLSAATAPSGFALNYRIDLVGVYPSSAENVFVAEDYAYLGTTLGSFEIVDVSDPSDPMLLGGLSQVYPNEIIVSGDYAYVAGNESSFQIIDVSVPGEAEIRGHYDASDDFDTPGIDIALENGKVYLAAASKMLILDPSDPDNPLLLGEYGSGPSTSIWRLDVNGDRAYVTANYPHRFEIVDVINPASPEFVGSHPSYLAPITVREDRVYVIGGSLQCFDVADPENPSWLFETYFDLGKAQAEIKGDFFAGALGSVLHLADFSAVPQPRLIGVASLPTSPTDIHIEGNMIYVCCGEAGLWIFRYVGNDSGNLVGVDINRDGMVNHKDQLLLMNSWHRSATD